MQRLSSRYADWRKSVLHCVAKRYRRGQFIRERWSDQMAHRTRVNEKKCYLHYNFAVVSWILVQQRKVWLGTVALLSVSALSFESVHRQDEPSRKIFSVFAAKMYSVHQRKFILNILAFLIGCSVTLFYTNVEKSCTNKQSDVLVRDQSVNNDNDIFLVILILSAPSNIRQRDAIRSTWLKINVHSLAPDTSHARVFNYNENGFIEQDSVDDQIAQLKRFQQKILQPNGNSNTPSSNLKILHYFAVSTAALPQEEHSILLRENEAHKDLLLLNDLYDSYANLTRKVLRCLEALDNMPSFKYLLKVDDDTYVKLDFLLEELMAFDRIVSQQTTSLTFPRPELYWGYFNGRANIQRSGQWKETNFHLSDRYLPYALGGGYVISRKLVGLLALNARFLSTFVSEDMSMGVWLSPYRNVYRKHDVRFDTAYIPRKCRRHHIVLHKRSVANMNDLHNGFLCTFKRANDTSIRRPKEYFYDWNRTPMQCCESVLND